MPRSQQDIPASGPEREALRQSGQFWTPDWVAEAMVAYAVGGGAEVVFDPAVGGGAFFRAARVIAGLTGRKLVCRGTEIDPVVLDQARQAGVTPGELAGVQIRDFLEQPPVETFAAIAGNPPYIRHHRIPSERKARLRAFGGSLLGTPLDGRAGLHVYFLLRALTLLKRDGRLAFIMPADTCEGVFAPLLWRWIAENYRLDVVVTFAPEASPFPRVDTNPVIFMLRNAPAQEEFPWVKCNEADTRELRQWFLSGREATDPPTLEVHQRRLKEALSTGLSRPPLEHAHDGPVLGQFASVMRGVVTGANEFFLLTAADAATRGITDEFLIRAIARTRDVPGDRIDEALLKQLRDTGRPTLLFSPDGRHLDRFPLDVRRYLAYGEALGLHNRPLISTRRPWYKMETRAVPPILFAYLGRRNARFIRNVARVTPLTGFLCVYPDEDEPSFIDRLWKVLSDPRTVANLALVGKSYGSGAIKVEPRALEQLPLPSSLVAEAGLTTPLKDRQLQMFG